MYHTQSRSLDFINACTNNGMLLLDKHLIPAKIYLFKVNNRNRNTRKRCEICSKLTIKRPELRQ